MDFDAQPSDLLLILVDRAVMLADHSLEQTNPIAYQGSLHSVSLVRHAAQIRSR